MEDNSHFEVIIVGGSYAGLSAALALGRSLRKVLILDSGQPCNQQTPHSHNFLTQDGKEPREIAHLAKEQVLQYPTITFHQGLATVGRKTPTGFDIETQAGEVFTGKKVLFATGLKDIMPDIQGFAACWGISILHCPYCHGYEVKNKKTGILLNGEGTFHYVQLISHWTRSLTLLTNGKSTLTEEETAKIVNHNIEIIETEIDRIEHHQGKIQHIVFKDGSGIPIDALYARPEYIQHCSIPEQLGCEFTAQGLLQVDTFQQTTVEGVYACGDNASRRALAVAVATGNSAGAFINHHLIEAAFQR